MNYNYEKNCDEKKLSKNKYAFKLLIITNCSYDTVRIYFGFYACSAQKLAPKLLIRFLKN